MLDSPDEVLKTVLIWLGRDPSSQKEEDLRAVEEQRLAVRPYIRKIHSSQYIDDLANGELCVAVGWSGDILQGRDRAAEAGQGVTIKYVYPKEGSIVWFDMLAIPAEARHPGNAHAYINYLMDPQVAASNSNYVKYASGNAASLPMVSETVKGDPGIYPTNPPTTSSMKRPSVSWAAIRGSRSTRTTSCPPAAATGSPSGALHGSIPSPGSAGSRTASSAAIPACNTPTSCLSPSRLARLSPCARAGHSFVAQASSSASRAAARHPAPKADRPAPSALHSLASMTPTRWPSASSPRIPLAGSGTSGRRSAATPRTRTPPESGSPRPAAAVPTRCLSALAGCSTTPAAPRTSSAAMSIGPSTSRFTTPSSNGSATHPRPVVRDESFGDRIAVWQVNRPPRGVHEPALVSKADLPWSSRTALSAYKRYVATRNGAGQPAVPAHEFHWLTEAPRTSRDFAAADRWERSFARYFDATVLAVLRRLSLVSTWCFQLDRYFVDPDRHVLIPDLQSYRAVC